MNKQSPRYPFTSGMRLRNAAEFARVFEAGTRSNNGDLTVIALPNGADLPRLGLAIARKHLRRAVARNRVKRAIRESFRANQAMLAGLDVVVMARPAAAGREGREIRARLERHWPTVRALRDARPHRRIKVDDSGKES